MDQLISDYLKTKGVPVKQAGSEQVCRCLFCDDEKAHMYVNDEKGVFHCVKCSAAGNIWILKKHFGDLSFETRQEKKSYERPKKRHLLGETGRQYLLGRGISEEAIKHFQLGQEGNAIAFPFYENGLLVSYKYRGIDKKEIWRFKGSKATLFNVDKIDRTKPILIVEGELDAISAWDLGFTNVISVPLGAGSFNSEWIDFFDSCTGTFLVGFDMDPAGEAGAEKLFEKLGSRDVRRVKLPLKDMNECLQAGFTGEDLKEWIASAKEYKPEHFKHCTEIFTRTDELFQRPDKGSGQEIPDFQDLTNRMGGARPGEITVMTGDTASGKSTLATNIFSKFKGPRLVASTENSSEQVMIMFFAMFRRKNFKNFTQEDYEACILHFAREPIYFIDVHGRLSSQELDDYISYGKRKYDIEFVLLDHLHFFIRNTSHSPVSDIENFVFDLVAIAKRTGVNIWLIAHPAKLNNSDGVVSMNDLKGSSAIKQDSHNVITVWRDREKEENGIYEVVLNVEKVRHTSGTGGKKRYIFDPASLSYREKPVEYGDDKNLTGTKYNRGGGHARVENLYA
ncbi:MAG: DnaB-like helicase C-terminal domain-containing protein [Candidatus Omnitrophota bacterium]